MEPRDLRKGDRLRIVADAVNERYNGKVVTFGRIDSYGRYPILAYFEDEGAPYLLGWEEVEMAEESALTPALEAAFRAKYGPQIGDHVKVKEGAGSVSGNAVGEGMVIELDNDGDYSVRVRSKSGPGDWFNPSELEVTAYGPGISSRKTED